MLPNFRSLTSFTKTKLGFLLGFLALGELTFLALPALLKPPTNFQQVLGTKEGNEIVFQVTRSIVQPENAVSQTSQTLEQETPVTAQTKPSSFPVKKPSSTQVSVSTIEALLSLVNKARAEHGVPALSSDAKLNDLAKQRSADMANNNYFSHANSAYATLLKNSGIGYKTAGENIARNNFPESTALSKAFEGWMGSQGHRSHILDSRFSHTGLGIVKSGNGYYYYTQIFVGY